MDDEIKPANPGSVLALMAIGILLVLIVMGLDSCRRHGSRSPLLQTSDDTIRTETEGEPTWLQTLAAV